MYVSSDQVPVPKAAKKRRVDYLGSYHQSGQYKRHWLTPWLKVYKKRLASCSIWSRFAFIHFEMGKGIPS